MNTHTKSRSQQLSESQMVPRLLRDVSSFWGRGARMLSTSGLVARWEETGSSSPHVLFASYLVGLSVSGDVGHEIGTHSHLYVL